jgi:phosphate transport system substrate-binding protein
LEAIWEPSSWINTWDQFDSKLDNKELQLYSPGTDSGTFDFFTEAIMGEAGMQRYDITPSEDDNVLVTGISRDPNAMGYIGYTYYEQNRDSLRAVAIDEGKGCVFPTASTVLNGSYSTLARPLLVYVSTEALKKQEVTDFITFFIENSMEIAEDAMFIELNKEGLLNLNEYSKLIYDKQVEVLK